MKDYSAEVFDWFAGRRKQYAHKLRWLVGAAAVGIVLLIALAIALSKIILPLLLVVSVIALVGWLIVKSKRVELSKLRKFIRKALEKLLKLLREKEDELSGLDRNPADYSLLKLLSQANDEERATLEKFVGKSFESPEQFEHLIRKKATHDVSYYLKRIKGIDEAFALASYSEMLDVAGEKMQVERVGRSDFDYERALVETAFSKMVGSMQEKDRKQLEYEMNQYAEKHLGSSHTGLALSSGGLALANLGGFTTFTMSTSLLAGASSALGIGLPFAAYTSFSSLLSIAIGPAGWAAIGLWSAHRMASPDKKATALVIPAMASIRARLIYEQELKKEQLEKEIRHYHRQKEQLEQMLVMTEQTKNLTALHASISPPKECSAIENNKNSSKHEVQNKNDGADHAGISGSG